MSQNQNSASLTITVMLNVSDAFHGTFPGRGCSRTTKISYNTYIFRYTEEYILCITFLNERFKISSLRNRLHFFAKFDFTVSKVGYFIQIRFGKECKFFHTTLNRSPKVGINSKKT